ncbi:hypothetical protein [Rhodococcoides kyotonense]|uniref:Uncharacterized protein n=1 Tax=Rhodococcoides kyotonense TaxID=398843 RepID=A0A239GU06_9NOCA|nr:hypothetical protein [Rhodococcus kyotonensis]SNS72461.1 hypothetical protein SAMN05421642_104397 [Rhodococcus kyotonensis]
MYSYEYLIREHELRVARSLARFELRKRSSERPPSEGFVLFAAARRAAQKSLRGQVVRRTS